MFKVDFTPHRRNNRGIPWTQKPEKWSIFVNSPAFMSSWFDFPFQFLALKVWYQKHKNSGQHRKYLHSHNILCTRIFLMCYLIVSQLVWAGALFLQLPGPWLSAVLTTLWPGQMVPVGSVIVSLLPPLLPAKSYKDRILGYTNNKATIRIQKMRWSLLKPWTHCACVPSSGEPGWRSRLLAEECICPELEYVAQFKN